jgi:hypothetical protein
MSLFRIPLNIMVALTLLNVCMHACCCYVVIVNGVHFWLVSGCQLHAGENLYATSDVLLLCDVALHCNSFDEIPACQKHDLDGFQDAGSRRCKYKSSHGHDVEWYKWQGASKRCDRVSRKLVVYNTIANKPSYTVVVWHAQRPLSISSNNKQKQGEATTWRKEKQKRIDVEGIRTLARLPGTA